MFVMPLKKIVIIGPESTGKSTLCAALAAHYHTEWVREYAREYLEEHGMGYGYETLTTIARGQLALEDVGPFRRGDQMRAFGRRLLSLVGLGIIGRDSTGGFLHLESIFAFGALDFGANELGIFNQNLVFAA